MNDLQINICPPRCGEKDHDWTGPWIKTDDFTSTITCAKCGLAKIDYDMLRLP